MSIIFKLTLVVCLFDPSLAMRLRENSNVLVPNNDVNIHAKVKTLLSDDKSDSKDLSENEIEMLSEVKNPKNEKLRHKIIESANKVFDDKNKNVEENQIDRDQTEVIESYMNVSDSSTQPLLSPTVNVTSSTAGSTALPVNATTSVGIPFTTEPLTWTSTAPDSNLTSPGHSETPTAFETTLIFKDNTTTSLFVKPTIPVSTTELPPTLSTMTTDEPTYDDLKHDECLLGKPERNLKWVTADGCLNDNNIKLEFGFVKISDLSRKFRFADFKNSSDHIDLKFFSLAYNELDQIPNFPLTLSKNHLEYLSIAGNNFSSNDPPLVIDALPILKHLDMRNCRMRSIKRELFNKLFSLEYLYLAYNQIKQLIGQPFPKNLIHLDLSYNKDINQTIPDELEMKFDAFLDLEGLQTLDLSYTRIESQGVSALAHLPRNLSRISLCYAQLPATSVSFILNNNFNVKLLDLSGNPSLVLTAAMFDAFSDTLEDLFVRDSNVKNLDWTRPLANLKHLNLYDNNIHSVTNAFSHMLNLEILNLEKNSIGNWYERLFAENDVLKILNLRENKLSMLTDEMKLDMSNVQRLALGKNEFECSCILQKFMMELFDATKAANITNLMADVKTQNFSEIDGDDESFEKISDSTRVSLGFRSYLRPEYDAMSRTYQKYHEMANQSVQALRISSSQYQTSHLALQSKGYSAKGASVVTVLFDYDEKDDNYKCRNMTARTMQSIISMGDMCAETNYKEPSYNQSKRETFIALSIAIPAVIAASVLLLVVYWKWWYIKYFFVLCKNSAILTFMDESDGGNEAIVKSTPDAMDIFSYDVFVSYSEQNREWVLDEFIPNVEKRESINVCLHERDFQVGYGILENIISCMDRSRCLLLLVSESFLLSQWCQFEMNLAQHRLLETRREKLILVLLEDIPVRKQPKTLKYLMRTKTYIKWPGSGSIEEKQMFWKRLKKAIVVSKWEKETYGSIA